MIAERSDFESLAAFGAAVTVVGSGPVGLALALRLAGRGVRVLVLESGGHTASAAARSLSEAENLLPENHHAPETAVARRLGGTSNLWGGRCLPFDAIDHAPRPWLRGEDGAALPAWPIGPETLAPWLGEACRFLDAGDPVFTEPLPGVRAVVGADRSFGFESLERWASDPRSQRVHAAALAGSPDLCVALGATVTGLEVAGGRVAALRLHLEGAGAGRLAVRKLVLAAGGNESTRLLLATQRDHGDLFGGRDGPLGRSYMGHLNGQVADIILDNEALHAGLDYHVDGHGSYVRRRIVPAPEVQAAARLPNVAFWPVVPEVYDAAHRSGPLSAVFLALSVKAVGGRLLAEPIRLKHVGPPPHDRLAHLRNVIRDLPRTFAFAPAFLWRNRVARPRLPGFFLQNPARRYGLEYHAEQLPDPESRLTLGEETDRLGLPRLRIRLAFSETDAAGVLRAHEALEAWLLRHGLGRLDWRHRPEARVAAVLREAKHGTHQIGTIRMGTDRSQAVVDADCRSFDLDNLHVVTTAVLPTSGQANPTLTAVQLALRLADHLAPRPA